MAAPNRGFFAVIGGLLVMGFDTGHFPGLFAHVEPIAEQERTALKP